MFAWKITIYDVGQPVSFVKTDQKQQLGAVSDTDPTSVFPVHSMTSLNDGDEILYSPNYTYIATFRPNITQLISDIL